eukprot:scaffold8972_cov118-Isochrysis_galbana.AAC.7
MQHKHGNGAKSWGVISTNKSRDEEVEQWCSACVVVVEKEEGPKPGSMGPIPIGQNEFRLNGSNRPK